MAKAPKKETEDQRRDALLKRLLETPPKPHKLKPKTKKSRLRTQKNTA